ncbi:pannexin-1-like [Etheostoma cragini]|uniref:pannexin-1-like n=1 Tax=Etheostoma cragini TaxID=417921 RepID=UPI00155E6857|nr:pannexin-1-like [Etheostoma cragini]
MAIAHVATEYVLGDFLLKDTNQSKNVRTELAVDKMVTCVAVCLPLVLISLAFAQEVSVGSQISCFAPSNFSWKQAAYVDSFCWASVHTHTLPLWLHKFFPYILLLVAVLMSTPALFWRFSAAPLLQSDLSFIMEELDRCYNRAIKLAKSKATSGPPTPNGDVTEDRSVYPLVEKFLMTKRCSRTLLFYYLLCRGLTLVTLLGACVYLGYYLCLASATDEFGCSLRVGLLASNPAIPDKVHCKLVAVGVFYLLSLVNLVLFIALIPAVIYASLRPFFCQRIARFLETYNSLSTVSVLPPPGNQCDDLSLYLLFLEENFSELKSYKYIKVLEMLKRRGECSGEDFDSEGLLQTLCPVKMDSVDGKKPTGAAGKPDQVKTNAADPAKTPIAPKNSCESPNSSEDNDSKMETEMKEMGPLLQENNDKRGSKSREGETLRQRAL